MRILFSIGKKKKLEDDSIVYWEGTVLTITTDWLHEEKENTVALYLKGISDTKAMLCIVKQ